MANKRIIIRKTKMQKWDESGEDVILATLIFKLYSKNASMTSIRKALHVSEALFYRMMNSKKYPIYRQAKAKGHWYGVEAAVTALQTRALGYDYKEVKTGERNGKKYYEETTKHVPPDTNAIKFLLINKGEFQDAAYHRESKIIKDGIESKAEEDYEVIQFYGPDPDDSEEEQALEGEYYEATG